MIDKRSTKAYKLEKENKELKKEIELLRNGNDITKIINDNVVFLKYQREQQEEIERLNNIIKEAINYIDDNTYYKDHKGHINIDDLYIILQKGSDK